MARGAPLARVYPTPVASVLSLVGALVFFIIGAVLTAQGVPIGIVFVLFSIGIAIYHVANLKGADVPTFEEAASTGRSAAWDISARLESLRDLHARGLITEEEYATKKAEVLERI